MRADLVQSLWPVLYRDAAARRADVFTLLSLIQKTHPGQHAASLTTSPTSSVICNFIAATTATAPARRQRD